MEALIGHDRAIIIDSIVTHRDPIGKVSRYNLEELPNTTSGHMNSAHDASLSEALEMGRALGAYLPDEINFVTVEAQKVYEFSDELTPAVAAAIPEAVRIIMDLLLESRAKQAPETNDHKS